MMAFVMNLAFFEEAVTSRRELVLVRMKLLQEDEIGFAALFVPLLKNAVDSWLLAVDEQITAGKHNNACEEKKEEVSVDVEPKISRLNETEILSRILEVHVAISRLDTTLAEEVGRQGSHAILSRLMRYDGSLWEQEEDQDAIMELQDCCCEVAALTGGAFPLKVAPFAVEDLKSRLPLRFHIEAVDTDASDCTDSESSSNSQVVLIHQITKRQSAQEDVGFVMWPSAVALSRWLVSNPLTVKGRTVLELGAGCGLTGLVAAGLEPSSVILSDFNPKVLENLERNIALNNVNATTVAVGLDFYQQSGGSSSGWMDIHGEFHSAVHVILAADVICQPSDAVAAAKTIHDALHQDGVAIVICADAKHRFGVDCFESECNKVGLSVRTYIVADLYGGQLVSREMELTTAYVDGMTLTLFQIEHASQR